MKLSALIPILLFLSTSVYGQAKRSIIYGRVLNWDSADETSRLVYSTSHSPLCRMDEEKAKIETTGAFRIELPPSTHSFRLFASIITDQDNSNYIGDFFKGVLVEPGDSVYIRLIKSAPSSGRFHDFHPFKAVFSGRGAQKYACTDAISSIKLDSLNYTFDIERVPFYMDSLLKVQLNILNCYKHKLSNRTFNTIKADIELNLRLNALNSKMPSFDQTIKDYATFKSDSLSYSEIVDHFKHLGTDTLLVSSWLYGQYLDRLVSIKFLFSRGWRPLYYEDYFKYIANNYSGIKRDYLLAYTLLTDANQYFYKYYDFGDYSRLLKKAKSLIKNTYLRSIVSRAADVRSFASIPFNFRLPADSSGKMISLTDFKGKVVLIDMWGFQCTGCYKFAKAFHQNVYPHFQNDSDFAVISIMLDKFANRKDYMRRLRQEGGVDYTYSNYINLYGGKGEPSARQMERYYNVNVAGFILLINKSGKIYSSRVPFFVDPDSPNVGKLISLIQNLRDKGR